MKRHSLLLTAILSLLIGPVAGGQVQPGSVAAGGQVQPGSAADLSRIRGSDRATLWLVIVGDLANPANREFQHDTWPLVDSLFVRRGKLRVAWVNLPNEASRASMLAAEIAACSGSGGKFWSVHDGFLLEQARWVRLADPTQVLMEIALQRGGRMPTVEECMAKHSIVDFLRSDAVRARGAGIRAAPGYILDNKVLKGVTTPDEFRAAIEQALAGKR